MSYRLVRFAGVTLPAAEMMVDFGPPEAGNPYSALIGGGAFSHYPAGAPVTLPYTVGAKAELVASSVAALRTAYDALAALVGRRYHLYRAAVDDATEQWAWATLVGVRTERGPRNLYWFPIQMTWQVEMWPWHGEGHGAADVIGDNPITFASGLVYVESGQTTLSSSPQTIYVTNGGNVPIHDCGIVVTAGGADITRLTIGVTGISEIEYSGTVAAGQRLVIDCGDRRVLNGGVAAWDDLRTTAAHVNEPWLSLEAGVNEIIVRITGGSTDSKIQFTFADGWA